MGCNNIVSMLQARRKRETYNAAWNPESIARRLCREVAEVCGQNFRWIPMAAITQGTSLSEEDVIVGAVYAHALGWIIYATRCVWLTQEGYAAASTDDMTLRSRSRRELLSSTGRTRDHMW